MRSGPVNTLLVLICALAVFKVPLFFATFGLTGAEYGGLEESPVYVNYIVAMFVLVAVVFVFIFFRSRYMTRLEVGLYTFVLLLFVNHALWHLLDPIKTELTPRNLQLFVLFGLPGILAAVVLAKTNNLTTFIRLVEPLALLIGLGLILAIVVPYFTQIRVTGIGGASYQAASYYAAFTFGLLSYFVFRAPVMHRYVFFGSRIGNLMSLTCLPLLFIATVINGGRGAFILLTIYASIVVYWLFFSRIRSYAGAAVATFAMMAVPMLGYGLINWLGKDPILGAGYRRAVAFIGGDRGGLINLAEGSSGRHRIYEIAWQGILDGPLVGYGVFGAWDRVIPPHNLLLDLWLQWGIPAGTLILTIGLYLVLKALKRSTESTWFFVILGFYPLVMLMFSGGYLINAFFLFVFVSFMLSGTQSKRFRQVNASCIQ